MEVLQEAFQGMFLIASSVTVGPDVSELAITGLRPFTNHMARVAAYNSGGKRFSSQMFFTTSKDGKVVLVKSLWSNLARKSVT